MNKPIRAAEMDYDKNLSLALREEVIRLRDEALNQSDFEWSVKLSHVIAWMAVVIEERWPDADR